MRVAAHNGARIWGGAERATSLLLRGLADRGHEVVLFCNDRVVVEGARRLGVPAEIRRIGGDIALPDALRIAVRLRQWRAEAFIIGTWKKLFLAALGARIAGVPRVVARVGLETDTARSLKYAVALRRWVDDVVVNASVMKRAFESLAGFDTARVHVIPNGVRLSPALGEPGALRRQLGIPDSAFVLGTVARLSRQKRIDRLIASVSLLDQHVHCIVAGDGELRDVLKAQARDLGLTARMHFVGHQDNVRPVLDALDAYVVTSEREGLSNSMLEAMAAGLPVISTPVSGAGDAIEGEIRAGLITGGEPAEIAGAVMKLSRDGKLRGAMAVEAKTRAESKFGFSRMITEWESLLFRAPASR